jgi:hypothetical protein
MGPARGEARQARAPQITFARYAASSSESRKTGTVENAPNWAISNLRVYEAGPGK